MDKEFIRQLRRSEACLGRGFEYGCYTFYCENLKNGEVVQIGEAHHE